ncbi:nSTAND1 domain-containing NTPase [Candidatus Entotheonella palauensis]|uniref:Novel STAND NTPase 2 domain-containing protein n=1 Tax=Candidatus Entotheonella gemina TaxID=1429439 RepID=W4M6F5_9BACT|nr:TniB family NTP-binding protein [Candidatus Entotheonella palauensis]ETX05511.1 MAG: hypothetical protein ETSY2_22470 [Candidatus Entotheonella gemina]
MTEAIPNPFTNRGVIADPDDFFGRQEELNEIFTRLRNMQSSSIVGDRRIGKSSLLYHLAQIGTQRLRDPHYRFVYLDLQDAHYHTAVGFLQTVLQKLDINAETIQTENTLNRNLIAFSDALETLENTGQYIVLCLDEFENTFKHREQFTEDFFDHMRAQLNIRKLAFVTATQHPLQRLSLEGKLTSPFYTLFTVVELGEFAEADAYKFLVNQNRKAHFTDGEFEFIFNYLQLHPLKLQILCDWVVKNRQRRLPERDLAAEITKEFGNFFVGTFSPRQFLRLKRTVSLSQIKRLLEAVKAGRDLLSDS